MMHDAIQLNQPIHSPPQVTHVFLHFVMYKKSFTTNSELLHSAWLLSTFPFTSQQLLSLLYLMYSVISNAH